MSKAASVRSTPSQASRLMKPNSSLAYTVFPGLNASSDTPTPMAMDSDRELLLRSFIAAAAEAPMAAVVVAFSAATKPF